MQDKAQNPITYIKPLSQKVGLTPPQIEHLFSNANKNIPQVKLKRGRDRVREYPS